ncbi:MAG TPA: hypothetical protein VIN58_20425 [Roseateles sp.]
MSMSVGGVSPMSYSAPQQPPNDAASFEQMLGQLANGFGVSPQELFNMIQSYMNPQAGAAPGASAAPGAPSASGLSGPGSSGGVDDAALKKVLGNFAANTLQAGQGMMKEAMEKFFQEDEDPDEDDPDAEPL